MVARTPYARIRGLGASGTGSREYWLLKLTSVALLVLSLFIIGVLFVLRGANYEQAVALFASPLVAIPLVLFILSNAVHMQLGMQNVIDDYVHSKGLKKLAVGANTFFSYGSAATAIYFLLRIGNGA